MDIKDILAFKEMLINQECMSEETYINDIPAIMLADTGATVTYDVKRKKFEEKSKKCQVELAETNLNNLSASRTPLHIYGKKLVRFKFRNKILYQTAQVADMTVEAVLGLDCLMAYKGIINLQDVL